MSKLGIDIISVSFYNARQSIAFHLIVLNPIERDQQATQYRWDISRSSASLIAGLLGVGQRSRESSNFMFYAATHGKISDYEHYVPPEQWRDEDILLPKQAPQAAYISAFGEEED